MFATYPLSILILFSISSWAFAGNYRIRKVVIFSLKLQMLGGVYENLARYIKALS
jgi:hypothetical protein